MRWLSRAIWWWLQTPATVESEYTLSHQAWIIYRCETTTLPFEMQAGGRLESKSRQVRSRSVTSWSLEIPSVAQRKALYFKVPNLRKRRYALSTRLLRR